MQPSSSYPGSPSPNKKMPNLRRPLALLTVVLVVGLVVTFLGVFQMLRGAPSAPRQASGPTATATSSPDMSMDGASATTTTTTETPVPGATPPPGVAPTRTPVKPNGAIRVTQNQDMRPACVDETDPYTVTLFNSGTQTANWHVNIPYNGGSVATRLPAIPHVGPFWANASPTDGTIAPGQSASFTMNVIWTMPCGGTTYHASVQLSFPSGGTQSDIPLSYAGTGPERYANVVVVSGSLNTTQACPMGGAAPAPFTFAIKNTGNYNAAVVIVADDNIGVTPWATVQITKNPAEPDSSLISAGQTWTAIVSPRPDVSCDGTVYHVSVYVDFENQTYTTITFTDTFN